MGDARSSIEQLQIVLSGYNVRILQNQEKILRSLKDIEDRVVKLEKIIQIPPNGADSESMDMGNLQDSLPKISLEKAQDNLDFLFPKKVATKNSKTPAQDRLMRNRQNNF